MGDTFVQWSMQSKKLRLKGNRAIIPNFSYSQMLYFSLAKWSKNDKKKKKRQAAMLSSTSSPHKVCSNLVVSVLMKSDSPTKQSTIIQKNYHDDS